MADEGGPIPEPGVPAAGVAACLPHVVDVFGEVGLARPVDLRAGEVDVGVDADVSDHDDVEGWSANWHPIPFPT